MIVTGHYAKGCRRAHLSSYAHEPFFGCPMIGTFNVKTKIDINTFVPAIANNGRRYWPLKINDKYEAWAFRWDGSKMNPCIWELVSRERLPDELRKGNLSLEIKEA